MPNDLQSPSSFGPDVLAVLNRAFDDVWLQLEGHTALAIRDATRRNRNSSDPGGHGR